MGYSKPYLRIFAFAGVLIIVGGLLFGLFQEARAVEMSFADDAPAIVTNSGTFQFDIVIPQGEAIPINTIDIVIEKQHPDQEGKTGLEGKLKSQFVTRANCPFNPSGGMVCQDSDGSLNLVQGTDGVVTKIELDRVFERSTGLEPTGGYTVDCSTDPACQDVDTPGYGYDSGARSQSSSIAQSAGYGYGYGYEIGRFTNVDFGSGTGYGYSAGDLVFRFNASISTDNLDRGKIHYITAIAATGDASGTGDSILFGDFSTPFHEFTARNSGGLSGGGGGGGGGLTVGVGERFTGSAGDTVRVTSGLPSGVTGLGLTLAIDCQGCTIHVSRSTSGTPGAEERGFDPIYFLTIEVRDSDGTVIDGAVSGGWLNFEVDQDELPGNSQGRQVTLLRQNNGWNPLTTTLDSASDADPLVYNGTLPGFSEFAVASDNQGPTFSDLAPTGITQQVTPTISASWDDNREVNPNSLVLTIDDVRHTSSMGDLSRTTDGFTYVPGTALSLGSHEVSATVKDISGLETTETWSFQVTTVDCPTPPRILSTQPTDGATDVALDTTITVTVEEGSCAIENSRLTINGEEVTATYANGELTATLTGVDAGETVNARAQVTDTGGNNAAQSWSFTTTQTPDEGPAPEDDGIPGWVWVIIVLLVIAAAVGGWYYYDQQQGGK